MCFDVAPSAFRSVHAALIFRSFDSPWHVAGNGYLRNTQLLGKHFLRLGIVLQLTVLNLPDFHVSQVKIVVIEPAKSISARCFR